jgi:hypothetical protein
MYRILKTDLASLFPDGTVHISEPRAFTAAETG